MLVPEQRYSYNNKIDEIIKQPCQKEEERFTSCIFCGKLRINYR